MKNDKQAWIAATRPRTLPLALTSIGMGAFLAFANGKFNGIVTILAMLTTAFLQILSNLANDYGDSIHGADNSQRKGPQRAVQSGAISSVAMRRAMVFSAICAMICGTALVLVAFGWQQLLLVAFFLLLGGAAIWAAINYTAGSNPYGYVGLGDLFVFLFFGLVGVLGSYFIQAHTLSAELVLPAISCGLLAVAVLNVNNIRDIDSDRIAGKYSVPVRFGRKIAQQYHWLLLLLPFAFAALYTVLTYHSAWQFLFLLALPLALKNGQIVSQRPSEQLDPMLKQTVLLNLAFLFTFGIGLVLSG